MISKVIRAFYRGNNPLSRFAITLKREYRVKEWQGKEEKVLEISGGRRPLSTEYLNVDVDNQPEVDVLANLLDPLPFSEGEVDRIVSVATLEHFNITHVRKVLAEMHRVLKSGGTLEIGVPSLPKIIAAYEQEGCTDTIIRYIHGAQKDEYDVHYFVVDGKRFCEELLGVGFASAEEVEYDYPRHDADKMMKLVAKK